MALTNQIVTWQPGSLKVHKANNRLLGKGFSPGMDDNHSSVGSKLTGLSNVLFWLWHLWLPLIDNPPNFCLACDGKSVLSCLINPTPIGLAELHGDLLSGAQALMHQWGIKVILVHVKGHQDGKRPTILACDATLNVEANVMARDKLARFRPRPSCYWIPFGTGLCYLGKNWTVKQQTTQDSVPILTVSC